MSGAAGVGARYRSWLVRPRLTVPLAWRTSVRQIGDRWARSLQLRVITTTLVLSVTVVGVLGYVLMQHLVTELYNDKVQSSVNIVEEGLQTVAGPNAFSATPNQGSRSDMHDLAQKLASTGGTQYALEVTLPPAFQGPPVYSAGWAFGFYGSPPRLPQELVNAVGAERANKRGPLRFWTSMAIGSSSRPVSGLLVGAPFGSAYQLYYFFPLAAEQQSITSMQRTLLAVGIAVVFLLAAIAWQIGRAHV